MKFSPNLKKKELNQRLFDNDESVLEEIFNKYWELLFSRAYAILENEDDVKDIIQVVLTDVWEKRKTKLINNLEAYLYQSVKYQVFKKLRDSKLTKNHIERFEEKIFYYHIDEYIDSKETKANLHKAVEQLPERCKEIYKLSRFQKLPHKEIAKKLNISEKTIENQITKANHHIKAYFTKL